MSKIYLVGGAVRDLLMHKESHDLDYVVVGSTPEEMEANGFKKVGADFPVFLHPKTRDEYALARTERKTGNGYNGFETFFDQSITIEDDLLRRDLTINAMAMDTETKEIVDPFNGKSDIENKVLRHVSIAFKDDPLRVLRVARFAARFKGFTIADETMELMRDIYDAGEMEFLTKERIWKEFSRAIMEDEGSKFFNVLQKVGVGKDIFPHINGFINDRNVDFVPPRINAVAIDESIKGSSLKERVARWSLSTFGQTNPEVINMWKNLSAPNDVVDHVSLSCSIWNRMLNDFSSLKDLSKADKKLYTIICEHDGFRRPERFLDAYNTMRDHLVMLSNNPNCIPSKDTIENWIKTATPSKEDVKKIIEKTEKSEIGKAIDKLKDLKWEELKKSINNKPRSSYPRY